MLASRKKYLSSNLTVKWSSWTITSTSPKMIQQKSLSPLTCQTVTSLRLQTSLSPQAPQTSPATIPIPTNSLKLAKIPRSNQRTWALHLSLRSSIRVWTWHRLKNLRLLSKELAVRQLEASPIQRWGALPSFSAPQITPLTQVVENVNNS